MVEKQPTTVLSIEDDEEFGKLLSLMLRSENITVVNAVTGQEGLRLAEDLKPDLVVLDLMMPDIHGWLVFEKMRQHQNLSDIPVIVVTALSSEAEMAYGTETAGVDAYMVKPIRAKDLRSTVASVLARSGSEASNGQALS